MNIDPDNNDKLTRTQETSNHEASNARRFMALMGYSMLALSPLITFALLWRGYSMERSIPPSPSGGGIFVWFMQYYAWETFSVFSVLFMALVGLKLLGAAGKATAKAIPPEDRELLEPLVRDANQDAIKQYVILSSLTGFTGTFQKIGFSGLPLATVSLTLFFCGLSFIKPEFIEFAKLTLGAFIGSFVQRGTDSGKLPSIKWDA